MADARSHHLPLVTFLFQPQVLTLWGFTSLLTWVVLLVPRESVLFIIAVIPYLLFAVVFLSYGFDIVENTALGHVKAPPFSDTFAGSYKRLSRQVFVLAMGFTLIEFTPAPVQWVTISLLLAMAPAISSSIVFHEPLTAALNPVRIWQFISNMGFGYMALRLMTTSVLLVCLFIASGELDFSVTLEGKAILSGSGVLLVLMMFRATGTLLHYRRGDLGIKTTFSTEQMAQGDLIAERDAVAGFLADVKREFRLKGTDSAYRLLELELKRHKYRDDAVCYDLLKEMADRRLLYRFAGGYVGRLIRNETGRAWAVLLEMHREARGGFQLGSGSDLLRLMETAETRDERCVLLELMEKFEQDFPQHPEVRQAWLCATSLALLVDDRARARLNLDRVEKSSGKLDETLLEKCLVQLGG